MSLVSFRFCFDLFDFLVKQLFALFDTNYLHLIAE